MNSKKNRLSLENFKNIIWEYYRQNKRDLPWRDTADPYHIFISEMMLQQTQVAAVIPKYISFIKKFPSFEILAKSSFSEVLSFWKGLGYNRRALYLLKASGVICSTYSGRVPKSVKALDLLPGIGQSTATSIYVFIFDEKKVFIETNIRRVFIYHFFTGLKDVSDKEILPLIEKTLPKTNFREWYYALMDYGSYLGQTFPNANRQSKQYTIQSKFVGSSRQVRGEILEILLKNKHVSVKSLSGKITGNKEHFNKALEELEKEGLVARDNGRVKIKD